MGKSGVIDVTFRGMFVNHERVAPSDGLRFPGMSR